MKSLFLSILATLGLYGTVQASPLPAPAINACNSANGIHKCDIKCARSLGDQCLITHINFEGKNLKSDEPLIRARFLTCKNANLDLQIKSLAIELEKLDQRATQAKITSTVKASGNQTSLNEHPPIRFDYKTVDGRLSRTYFKEFISSGNDFVEAEINLKQCGHEDASNSCKVSGTLVAVTDPNIRCDFHDISKPGAFVNDINGASVGRTGGGN